MIKLINLVKELLIEAPIYSKKVGDYKYKGFTTADEYNVFTKISSAYNQSHKDGINLESVPNYIKYIDTVYEKIISNNPELKDIKTSLSGYRGQTFPKHDIVFGALSGIPPEDIKYYVEITKGHGASYKGKNKAELDDDKSYVAPVKKQNKKL